MKSNPCISLEIFVYNVKIIWFGFWPHIRANRKRSWEGPRTPKRLYKRPNVAWTPPQPLPVPLIPIAKAEGYPQTSSSLMYTPPRVTDCTSRNTSQSDSDDEDNLELPLPPGEYAPSGPGGWKGTFIRYIQMSCYKKALALLATESAAGKKAMVQHVTKMMSTEIGGVTKNRVPRERHIQSLSKYVLM